MKIYNVSAITASLRDMTSNQRAIIEDCLLNFENSTDEMLIELFMENGVPKYTAQYLVEVERDFYMEDFRYSVFNRITDL